MEYDSNINDPIPIGNCFKRFNNFLSVDELDEIEQFSDAQSSFVESSVDYESLSRQLNGINSEETILCEDDKYSCFDGEGVSNDNNDIQNENYDFVEWLDFQEADTHENESTIENCKQCSVLETLSEIFSIDTPVISNEQNASLNNVKGDELWNNLIQCDKTPALKFTWFESRCRMKLINSLQLHPPFSLKQANPRI